MKAREIMIQPVVTVQPKTPLAEVAEKMLQGIGAIPIGDSQGKLVGITSRLDLLKLRRDQGR